MILIDKKTDTIKFSGLATDIDTEMLFALSVFIRHLRNNDHSDDEIVERLSKMFGGAMTMAQDEEVWKNGSETIIRLPNIGGENE